MTVLEIDEVRSAAKLNCRNMKCKIRRQQRRPTADKWLHVRYQPVACKPYFERIRNRFEIGVQGIAVKVIMGMCNFKSLDNVAAQLPLVEAVCSLSVEAPLEEERPAEKKIKHRKKINGADFINFYNALFFVPMSFLA